MTKDDLYRFLTAQKYGVLGTISPENLPQAALVGIAATADLDLIFDTLTTSRKHRNLVANPRVSFVVGWENEITLQYEGLAEELRSPALETYKSIYFAKWPECRAHETWPHITYIRVRPGWIRYSDYNTRSIEEFTFQESQAI